MKTEHLASVVHAVAVLQVAMKTYAALRDRPRYHEMKSAKDGLKRLLADHGDQEQFDGQP